MSYRIRYVSDGGPVSRDNMHGWPVASQPYRTLLAAMKALRDVLCTDARIGVSLGVALQYRFFGGEWHWMSAAETDKAASNLRIQHWKNLTATMSDPRPGYLGKEKR
jgi:hypothetical protein